MRTAESGSSASLSAMLCVSVSDMKPSRSDNRKPRRQSLPRRTAQKAQSLTINRKQRELLISHLTQSKTSINFIYIFEDKCSRREGAARLVSQVIYEAFNWIALSKLVRWGSPDHFILGLPDLGVWRTEVSREKREMRSTKILKKYLVLSPFPCRSALRATQFLHPSPSITCPTTSPSTSSRLRWSPDKSSFNFPLSLPVQQSKSSLRWLVHFWPYELNVPST